MGGKNRNCSGCKGYHKAPWGPNLCKYLEHKSGTPTSPGGLSSVWTLPPAPTPPTREEGDNIKYVSYLQDRIDQLDNYHHQRDEEDHIKELELPMQDLEISAQ